MIIFPSALRYRPSGAGVRAPLASISISLLPTISPLAFYPEGKKTSKAKAAVLVRQIAITNIIPQAILPFMVSSSRKNAGFAMLGRRNPPPVARRWVWSTSLTCSSSERRR
jgi:hypothetical protein